jgi:hypothetical protein
MVKWNDLLQLAVILLSRSGLSALLRYGVSQPLLAKAPLPPRDCLHQLGGAWRTSPSQETGLARIPHSSCNW